MFATCYYLLLYLAISCTLGCNAANILALFPHGSENHFALMRTFMKELIRQGHNITLYNGHGLDEPLDNLLEYKIKPEFDFWQTVRNNAEKMSMFKNLSDLSEKEMEFVLSQSGYNLVENFLTNRDVEELLSLPLDEFSFDVIVIDVFYTEALLALCHYFSRPCIGIVSSDFANYLEHIVDMMVPSACLPYDLHKTEYLDFWRRLHYTQSCMERRQQTIDGHYALQQQLIQKFLTGRFKEIEMPSIPDLLARLALLLLNNYPPLQLPRPLSTNMISVGGMQISRPGDLPWYVRRFLDEARKGAVYINLGDHHQCSTLNQTIVKILLHELNRLKLRIVWTCHQTTIEKSFQSYPGDFLVEHLPPQTDILAHPHIKLYITNGDLINLQEAIVRQVPILGLPLFNNEIRNVKLVEHYQIGVRLNYENITNESLRWALSEMWDNEYYVVNIRSLAKVFRDRPLGGLAQAIFWLEYVVSYGGTHLTMPASVITLQQLHLQDLYIYKLFSCILLVAFVATFGYCLWIYLKKQQSTKITSKLS